MLIGRYFKNTKPKFKNHYFSGLSFDSRKCKKNNIFFAVKGNAINGNQFIQDAIKDKVNEACKLMFSVFFISNFEAILSIYLFISSTLFCNSSAI